MGTDKADFTGLWIDVTLELVGIYTDEGISGTIKKKRDGFLQLLRDCETRKIDFILTKFISRFARNTVDLLTTIRDLKSKKYCGIF